MRVCPICDSDKVTVIGLIEGYVKGSYYYICECRDCLVSYSDPRESDQRVYEAIYHDAPSIPGYSRYHKIAHEILGVVDPIAYLSDVEEVYYAVNEILSKDKPTDKIVEIGCGHGYLTYALKHCGYDIAGVDISERAIKKANSLYDACYYHGEIEDYLRDHIAPVSHVICTEVLEHIVDPLGFVRGIINKLDVGGKLIMTTPNKVLGDRSIWCSDQPPVHLWWFSKKCLQIMGEKLGCRVSFFNYNDYYRANPIKYNKGSSFDKIEYNDSCNAFVHKYREPVLSSEYLTLLRESAPRLSSNITSLIKSFLPRGVYKKIRNYVIKKSMGPFRTDESSISICVTYEKT